VNKLVSNFENTFEIYLCLQVGITISCHLWPLDGSASQYLIVSSTKKRHWVRSCASINFGGLYTFFLMGYLYLTNGLPIFSRSCGLLMLMALPFFLNGLAIFF
jgi:hypothetical protein